MLTSLHLHHFRCYSQRDFQFNPQLTVLVGPNAVGKSSVLEALYLLGRGKSFRAGGEEEMIREIQEIGRVKVVIASSSGNPPERGDLLTLDVPHEIATSSRLEAGTPRNDMHDTLEVVLTHGIVQGKRVARKRFLLNGAGKRHKDLASLFPVVLFEPQDLMLVLGSPGHRREYLDGVLGQVDWKYAQALTTYQKALRQRNRLLQLIREGVSQRSQLDYWDQMVLEHGQYLQQERQTFLTFVQGWLKKLNQSVQFGVEYQPNLMTSERLGDHYEAQVATGTTLVGPHRDEVGIRIQESEIRSPSSAKASAGRQEHESTENTKTQKIQKTQGSQTSQQFKNLTIKQLSNDSFPVSSLKSQVFKLLASYGSRGQQRLGVLDLKLAELEYISQKMETKPLLLLDDIFSELDEENRGIVMRAIKSYQTVVTTTEKSLFHKKATVIALENS